MQRDPALDINPLDAISRERWSMALVAVMVGSLPIETIHAMAAGGFDYFLRVAAPIAEGHAFRRSDFQRMFSVIESVSKRGVRPNPADILLRGVGN